MVPDPEAQPSAADGARTICALSVDLREETLLALEAATNHLFECVSARAVAVEAAPELLQTSAEILRQAKGDAHRCPFRWTPDPPLRCLLPRHRASRSVALALLPHETLEPA